MNPSSAAAAVGPVDPGAMRRLNSSTTLRELHRRKSATLTELVDHTGLSRRTVELILEDLTGAGQVVERSAAPVQRTVGRPARTFAFNAQHAYAAAVQIAQGSIDVLVCDLYGTTLGTWTEAVSERADRAERLARVRSAVESVFRTLDLAPASVRAVTMATMGVVRDDGVVELKGAAGSVGPAVPDWSGFSIARSLDGLFECDVLVENDAKLAAIGEGWRGGARTASDYVYVMAEGRRVGVGVVIGGRLLRGRQGQAGEISWAQPVFGLGEALGPNPLLALASPESREGRAAVDWAVRARHGDAEALEHVAALAAELAPGLHGICCLLSPEVLVIGGAFGEIGSPLTTALEREFATRTNPGTRIALSQLARRAVLLGAMRSSLDRIELEIFSPA